MTTLAYMLTMWEDVEAKLQRMVTYREGNPLSDRDNRTLAAAFASLGCLLCDLRERHSLVGSDREIIAFLRFAKQLDVKLFASWLTDALVVLRNVDQPQSVNWFKRQLAEYPVGMLVLPVKGVLERFLESPSAVDFDVLSQFLSYLTRLTLQDLEIDLEDEYLELENQLNSQYYPKDLLNSLNAIMREWFADFHWKPVVPHHGPGATAETRRRSTLEMKYSALSTDATLSYVLSKHLAGDNSLFPYEPNQLVRESVLVYVPKSMKTRRTISKEPAGLMYIQQGVKDQIADFIDDHPYLQSHLTLKNQSNNGRLALRGSRNGSFSTIDLSSASDTVTTQLVKAVFRSTGLLSVLLGTRSSSTILPSGRVVRLAKFAPMGSALCFPVESLIFAAVVEHAVRRARKGLGNFPTYYVYGDDIVVEDALYEDVVLLLEALGFIPNRSKSYTSPSRFRESCGIEAFDGVDVTPLRISRRFFRPERGTLRHHPSLYGALHVFLNRIDEYKYPVLRAFLLRMIFDGDRLCPLFSSSFDVGIHSVWPDNYRAARRWNRFLQRQEIRVDLVQSVEEKSSSDDERGALFETLRLTRNRVGDMFDPDHLVRVPRGTVSAQVKRTWVDIPDFTVRSDQ